MNFEDRIAPGGDWEIQPDGWIWVNGIGGTRDRKWFGEILKNLTDALAEYDRQVEANKPKPGVFEVGDTVTWAPDYVDNVCLTSQRYRVGIVYGERVLVDAATLGVIPLINHEAFIKVDD